MESIQIRIFIIFAVFFGSTIFLFAASSEKSGLGERADGTNHMQHPPHDHHQTDHIKKLDEGLRRKRKDQKSH